MLFEIKRTNVFIALYIAISVIKFVEEIFFSNRIFVLGHKMSKCSTAYLCL